MAGKGRVAPVIPEDCRTCQVRERTMCAPMSDGDLVHLEAYKTGERIFAAGTDFLEQGETNQEFFTLLDGWPYLYELLEDGRRQILDFALSDDVLGFQPEPAAPLMYSARALIDISVCAFPRDSLLDFVRAHPDIGLRIACIAARDHHLAYNHLSNVGRRPAKERVANLLLELFYRIRLRSPKISGDGVPLLLTQEHIGNALGLTSVHVNRTLRSLREDGIVALNRGTLHIIDPDRLAEIAGFEAEVDVPRR